MRQTGWVHRSERPSSPGFARNAPPVDSPGFTRNAPPVDSPGFTRNAPPVEPQNVSSTESATGNEPKTQIENPPQAVISASENTPAETITEAPSSSEQPLASSAVEQETQNEPA